MIPFVDIHKFNSQEEGEMRLPNIPNCVHNLSGVIQV